MRVELHYFTGCPHASSARALLVRCLAQLELDTPIIAVDGDHPSPTILVDGRDVMGTPTSQQRSCRLDVPTESAALGALRDAASGGFNG